GGGGRGGGGAAGHVPLPPQPRLVGFDQIPAGVEGDCLADEPELPRLRGRCLRAVDEVDEARFAGAAAADGGDGAHPEPLHLGRTEDGDLQTLLRGDAAGVLGERRGVADAGPVVREVPGEFYRGGGGFASGDRIFAGPRVEIVAGKREGSDLARRGVVLAGLTVVAGETVRGEAGTLRGGGEGARGVDAVGGRWQGGYDLRGAGIGGGGGGGTPGAADRLGVELGKRADAGEDDAARRQLAERREDERGAALAREAGVLRQFGEFAAEGVVRLTDRSRQIE